MAEIALRLLTMHGTTFEGVADAVTAPTVEGAITVLPNHARLITQLGYGDLGVRYGSETQHFAVSGGFMEVKANAVTVFADAAERDDQIDLERAEQALARAQKQIEDTPAEADMEQAMRAVLRAKLRIKVARRRPSGAGRTQPPGA